MNFHPIANLFPMMQDDEFNELVEDIRAHGQREPIWIVAADPPKRGEHKCYAYDESKCDLRAGDGVWTCGYCGHNPALLEYQILDGRNRFLACKKLGIEPIVEYYDGDDPLEFVFSLNLHRRQLTAAQKAAVALKSLPYFEKRAKKRQLATLKQWSALPDPERIPEREDEKAEARQQAAERVSVNPRYVSDAKRIQKEAPELVDKLHKDEITIPQALREIKERQRASKREENRELIAAAPEPAKVLGVYSTIVIDPPWDWGDEGDQDQLGRARPTYGTMSIDELLALPVGDYAAPDCHLYLWITNRSLPKGFALMERWGFRYVTCVTWAKPSFGMGNYFRGQTEHVLFGVRGSLQLKRKDVGTLFSAPRGPRGHSSKPVEFYDFVESCSPGPYLEMFARGGRPDWTAWGAEANAA